MRHPEGLTEYTQELAVCLTIETGDLYTAEITPGAWYQVIHGPQDSYHVSFDDDRTVISTCNTAELNPHTNHYKNARATFATSRGTATITKEIIRRLRPNAQAQRAEATQEKAKHDEATRQTRETANILTPWMNERTWSSKDRRIEMHDRGQFSAKLSISDGKIYEMHLFNISPAQAVEICKILERK